MAPQEPKNRKPANTAFKQQRLKAWQPILTPKTVLPTFFIVGIIFAPLGGLLLYFSDSVSELSIDYTDCIGLNIGEDFAQIPSKNFGSSFAQTNSTPILVPKWKLSNTTINYVNGEVSSEGSNGVPVPTKQCTIQFTVQSPLKPPVFLYYRLTNFFQNHRRYVKSFDAKQLKGDAVGSGGLSTCGQLTTDSNGTIYYPCGLIANSLFNDTLNSPVFTDGNIIYNFSAKGIAWPSDRQKYGETKYQNDKIVPPPNWALKWPNGYSNQNLPINPAEDEHFQVWMRTAGLPDFRKLYGKNTLDVMQPGTYEIVIDYNFPVKEYAGTKSLVISTASFLGGKNPFLGIAYIAVGIICVVLGCIFTATHLYKPRKLGDHTYLSWNQNNVPVGSHRDQ